MLFDVLSPNAAVMTATYHVPHLTPRNQPHTIGGAWTAVFQKRGDRWYIIQEHLSDLPPVPDSAAAPMPPGMKMPAGHHDAAGRQAARVTRRARAPVERKTPTTESDDRCARHLD